MRRRGHIWSLTCGILAALAGAPAAQADPGGGRPDGRFEAGEAIVRYEPGTTAAERAGIRDGARVELDDALGLPRAQLVTFSGAVQDAVARLERQPGVAYAQPNYRYHTTADAPDDTFFAEQWALGPAAGVDVLPAWDRNRGAGQVIAILDTGIDLTHPDLAASIVAGWDFVSGDSNADDHQYHGTHVAGIAAAAAGNGQGVAGVAPQAQLMPVRVLDGDGSGSTSEIAQGIQWAASAGATVINMSLGGPSGAQDQIYSDAVAFADSKDVVVVVAAGNQGRDNDTEPTMPCSIPAPNLICVAALRSDGTLAGYSNFGAAAVDLAAPGSSILSAKTDWAAPLFGTETFESGTGAWTTTWSVVDSSDGTKAATDSPSGNYAANSVTPLVKSSPVDLTGQRGCRMHFDVRHQLGSGDALFAGADAGSPTNASDGDFWTGTTGGLFANAEVSLSELDGRNDVKPTFEVLANDDAGVGDGAYVDNVRVLCRASTYTDATLAHGEDYVAPASGSYWDISGTSMASPHVAGVAALVRAADPGASNAQVVEAIKAGVKPLASPADAAKVGTGGRADALGAIDAVLGTPNPPPAEDIGTPTTTTTTTTTAPTQETGTVTRPGPAGFAGRVRVDSRGRLSIRVAGQPLLAGRLTLKSRGRLLARPTAFRLGLRGRALVRVRLNARGRRLLRRSRRVTARASVRLRNDAGLSSTTFGAVRLRRG